MSDELLEFDERMRILREKADREGFTIGDDVLRYIAGKYGLPQTLKGALINVSAYAHRRGTAPDLAMARLVLDGIRDEPVVEVAPDVEPEPTPVVELSPDIEPVAELPLELSSEPLAEPELLLAPEPAPHAASSPEPAWLSAAPAQPEAPWEEPEPEDEWPPVEAPLDVDEPAVEPHVIEPAADLSETLFVAEAPPVAETAYGTSLGAQPPASTVWFAPVRSHKKQSLVARAGGLLQRAGLPSAIAEGDLVAIKLHFGEEGNTGFVHPVFLREVVRLVRDAGGRPFLTDSNTLYRGKRFNAVDHITCAMHNGFSFATVDAPVIIADGLDGREACDVAIENGKHFESVRIGSAAVHADAMIVVTHVKGHEATGFGGALKNVGMGLGCRSAKQRMHADFEPHPSAEKCTACGRCVKWCPVDAITIGPDRVAEVDRALCYGCGECVAACPYGAIAIEWKTDAASIQEKIAEHCAGALADKDGKVLYLSFITNVSPDCDCWHFSDASIVSDIGVLASTDIVAIDQASYDLVREARGLPGTRGEGMAEGVDKFKEITGIDGTLGIAHAERLRLGTRRYELKTVE